MVLDLVGLVQAADVFLSIVPPRAAQETAAQVAAAMRESGASPLYADCNAITPETARTIGATITAAGASFIDASIAGGPPRPGTAGPKFFASGADVAGLMRLRDHGLDVRGVGTEIGQASALKMCCAVWAQGTQVLATELLAAAALAGVVEPLLAQLRESDPGFLPYWNVLEPLLQWKPGNTELGRSLVERWDISLDGRVWTFVLRRGIQFRTPYSELTSEDVRLSFERFRDVARADSPGRGDWANVENIDVVDRYTVRVTLRDPRELLSIG